MNLLPRNKWTAAALLWFAAAIYALIFRESSGHAPPPFPHFDKLAHALLFFAQTHLAAKAFIHAGKHVPFRALLLFGLLFAVGSELGQHWFTQTREGDVWDAAADMAGTGAALAAAAKIQTTRRHLKNKFPDISNSC